MHTVGRYVCISLSLNILGLSRGIAYRVSKILKEKSTVVTFLKGLPNITMLEDVISVNTERSAMYKLVSTVGP